MLLSPLLPSPLDDDDDDDDVLVDSSPVVTVTALVVSPVVVIGGSAVVGAPELLSSSDPVVLVWTATSNPGFGRLQPPPAPRTPMSATTDDLRIDRGPYHNRPGAAENRAQVPDAPLAISSDPDYAAQ